MCGIVAEYGSGPVAPEDATAIVDRLAHRGPDGRGFVSVGDSWLGHRRLAIVDVAGGDQPLSAGDDHLVGNGEIYNHGELRRELDEEFSTGSDNEAILRLLRARGPEGLAALRGMFAFCAASADGRFVAARDPVGIKPLYWARRDGRVRFASELRAFDPEWRDAVEVFPPGHSWTPEDGLRRFATVDRLADERFDPAAEPSPEVVKEIRETVTAAVERRMMADVPVGVFLSGGLDSSLVAAVAAAHLRDRGERLQTFAVGVAGSPDLAAARTVAEHLGSLHRERVYTAEEAAALLPVVVESIESYEPSLVRSAVPNFLLAELAAQHVKVVLTGEGADELFAGYEYLREVPDEQLHGELVRILEGLHNLNLQRCDRVTMTHGLEARVPFLDLDVIALGLALPAEWKLAGPDRPEKQLLRLAFADALPHDIVWRKKAQFGDGSGARDALAAQADAIGDDELAAAQRDRRPPPRTKEELVYQRIFDRRFAGIRDERVLGRFATA